MFKNKELNKKILFTLLILVGIRLGNQIPTYGVNKLFFQSFLSGNASLSFLNSITGNSLKQLSVFALSITPYITASIIVQLLTIAIPALEDLSKDGKDGHDKIEKITYITAGVLGYVEALCMAIGFGKQGLLLSYKWYNCLIVGLIWGTFALFSIFLGKLIDKKGIGNGISLILFCNIISSLPSDLYILYSKFLINKKIYLNIINLLIILLFILAIFAFALILNNAEKRINIQYSGKYSGNQMQRGASSYIPIKLMIMGVMPVIFASSIISLPGIIGSFIKTKDTRIFNIILNYLNVNNWFNINNPIYSVGYILYALLVIFFGYFYTSIAFNTYEVANNLKKSGGTVCGIRPGAPTVEYLNKQTKYLVFIGTAGLLILATIPMIVSGIFNLGNLSFGGTTIIIAVSVIFETKKQLEMENAVNFASNKFSIFH